MTSPQKDLIQAVADSSMMVAITITSWSGRKSEKTLANDVADKQDADPKAFRVTKELFSGDSHILKDIRSIQAEFRANAARMTVPMHTTQSSSGMRLLANAHLKRFVKMYNESRRALNGALDTAVARYDNAIQRAERELGKAFDESDYPTADAFRGKFVIDVDFLPVPTGDAFGTIALPEGAAESLSNRLEERMEERADTIREDLVDRAKAHAERVLERMEAVIEAQTQRDMDVKVSMPRLTKTLFSDAEELAEMMSDFAEILSDTSLQQAANKLANIGAVEPDHVRGNLGAMERMRGFAQETLDCFEVGEF